MLLLFSCSVVSTLCDPVDCSIAGFPVLHCLPRFAQTHVHWVVRPSNHLILCRPLLLLPAVFPSVRIFSSESALRIRWPQYWRFSFSINPSNKYSGFISFRLTGLISLLSKGLLGVFSSTTVKKQQFFGPQPSLWFNSHIHTWLLDIYPSIYRDYIYICIHMSGDIYIYIHTYIHKEVDIYVYIYMYNWFTLLYNRY